MSPAGETGRPPGARRSARKAGFTLVEVMVATVLLTVMFLSILQTLIFSYQIAAKARYRDSARYVIRSYADQFMTQDTTDSSGNVLSMFVPSVDSGNNSAALGTGLTWTNPDGSSGTVNTYDIAHALSNYQVVIGGQGQAPITASVTRQVWYVYPGTSAGSGSDTLVAQFQPAGNLLEGDFAITYSYLGQVQPTLKICCLRATP